MNVFVVCVEQQEQFGLYALYSKNKPKSDALLANHGHSFFRVRTTTTTSDLYVTSYLYSH